MIDLHPDVERLLRSVHPDRRAEFMERLFQSMDEKILGELCEENSLMPNEDVPTDSFTWMQRTKKKETFGISNLESETTAVASLLTNPTRLSAPGHVREFHYSRYLGQIRSSYGDDAADAFHQRTSQKLASSGCLIHDGFVFDPSRNGVVVGSVQSGKSGSFIGLAAAAMDLGVKTVLVLSGMTDKLRHQTQQRLNRDLIEHSDHIVSPTSKGDLTRYRPGNRDSEREWANLREMSTLHLKADDDNRIVLVVKKHIAPLAGAQELLEHLSSHQALGEQPVLIIDDECDHASANSMSELWDGNPRVRASEVHKAIVGIRTSIPSVFWGYTATPQAQIFMHPDDALAPHSAHILESHAHYLGPWDVFVQYKDALVDPCNVGDFELPAKGSDAIPILQGMATPPTSMVEAMLNYAISGGIHHLQPRSYQPHGDAHAMMIHIIRDIDGQVEVLRLVTLAKSMALKVLQSDSEENQTWKAKLIRRFRKNRQKFRSQHNSLPPLVELLSKAVEVLCTAEIRLLNSESDDQLDYADPGTPTNLILVGGDVLARGLTIEGLRTTLFLREPSSALIDSTLQSARWFGPHKGDIDLISIHMRHTLATRFERIAWADAQLRDELRHLTETGQSVANAKIHHHPGYHPTGKGKSRNCARLHSAGDRVMLDQPYIGTSGRAEKVFSESLQPLAGKAVTPLYGTPKKGKVSLRGVMFDLSPDEFLTFWKKQLVGNGDKNKHQDVVTRVEAMINNLGKDQRYHLVIRSGTQTPMSDELPAFLRKHGLRRVKRSGLGRKISQLASGRTPGQGMYTSDWYIDGFEPSTPTANARGWRTHDDPILCVAYLIDENPQNTECQQGSGVRVGFILHFPHSGPGGSMSYNIHATKGGEEE